MSLKRIVIAGAGQGGFQVAASLRQDGFDGEILLVGDEPGLPYQRPPLSKEFIKTGHAERLLFRNADFYQKNAIDYRDGRRVTAIHRAEKTVEVDDGARHGFDHLVLAVGARNRRLPIPGIDLEGVLQLRTLADAERIRAAIAPGLSLVVIGGGFIGLEIAATAAAGGAKVTVLEATDRLMSRVVSPAISEHFLAMHRAAGVDVRLGCMARGIRGDDRGRAGAVEVGEGEAVDADIVLVSAGIVPNVEIAEAAGLYLQDGIRVDDTMATEAPEVSAIGDCASFPIGDEGVHIRLESVQNAIDQAKCVVQRLLGKPEAYDKVPWFWSDQAAYKLQIAGLTAGADHQVARPSEDGAKLTVHCFRHGALIGVETVNAPADHMVARRLLALPQAPTLETIEAKGYDLKAVFAAAQA
jgi:3-phenylpropionate/trans-cinnamate dioxygenase ferredoxin reductase subunit